METERFSSLCVSSLCCCPGRRRKQQEAGPSCDIANAWQLPIVYGKPCLLHVLHSLYVIDRESAITVKQLLPKFQSLVAGNGTSIYV